MSRRTLPLIALVLLVGAIATLAQDRRPTDSRVEARLKLARAGYKAAMDEYLEWVEPNGRTVADFSTIPIWSGRIMESERLMGNDRARSIKDHLGRLRDLVKLVVERQRHVAENFRHSTLLDLEYAIQEAEDLLTQAKAATP
jgi:hypothetical protein